MQPLINNSGAKLFDKERIWESRTGKKYFARAAAGR